MLTSVGERNKVRNDIHPRSVCVCVGEEGRKRGEDEMEERKERERERSWLQCGGGVCK